ncbi:NAD(P)H dehydrogenase (quinone) [Xanthomonas arboricola]|nr:NAD(P)H dehydrogenase (quinone) [Xanthomonas sp. 4461]
MLTLLKGWIDQVFTLGWAFEEDPEGRIRKKPQHVDVNMLAIGGVDERTYARHGYFGAMKTQIAHDILLTVPDAGFPIRTWTRRTHLAGSCLIAELRIALLENTRAAPSRLLPEVETPCLPVPYLRQR